MALNIVLNTTNRVTATVTDRDGDPVTGATATVSIVDLPGTALVENAAMTEEAGGVYAYTTAEDLFSLDGSTYFAEVTITSGQNQAFARIRLNIRADRD